MIRKYLKKKYVIVIIIKIRRTVTRERRKIPALVVCIRIARCI